MIWFMFIISLLGLPVCMRIESSDWACVKLYAARYPVNNKKCGSNVNLTGINGNVIMSGCGNGNPGDARREAHRDHSKSISRWADGAQSGCDSGAKRATVLSDQRRVYHEEIGE